MKKFWEQGHSHCDQIGEKVFKGGKKGEGRGGVGRIQVMTVSQRTVLSKEMEEVRWTTETRNPRPTDSRQVS